MLRIVWVVYTAEQTVTFRTGDTPFAITEIDLETLAAGEPEPLPLNALRTVRGPTVFGLVGTGTITSTHSSGVHVVTGSEPWPPAPPPPPGVDAARWLARWNQIAARRASTAARVAATFTAE